MQLHPLSKELVTINIYKGLFHYTRLPFGVASAPAITMDSILQGIPRVHCYIDDILISGCDDHNHLQNLKEVLQRFEDNAITVKKSKCSFFQDSVEYLGHVVDKEGLHTAPGKLKAIQAAPAPTNIRELRSFLSLINYGRFIANLSSILHPLNMLLKHGVKLEWIQECDRAFNLAKKESLSSQVLAHFNPKLSICLATDASAYGLGAVLSHHMPNGEERPIAFASRTLSPAECNYSQIEKDALSLIFGIKKFHLYIYGQCFTLLTDHKPLVTILGPKLGIPTLAAARLQRWPIYLFAYSFKIGFRGTKEHANADALLRLPLQFVYSGSPDVTTRYT